MKAYDLIGNEISKGDILYFQSLKAIVRVLSIDTPGVIDPNQPGCIILEFKVPFRLEKGEKDVRFGDFLITKDPVAQSSVESQIDAIVGGAPNRPFDIKRPLQVRGNQ
jgi:hypothetical protein